jgi:hypothetical protein
MYGSEYLLIHNVTIEKYNVKLKEYFKNHPLEYMTNSIVLLERHLKQTHIGVTI